MKKLLAIAATLCCSALFIVQSHAESRSGEIDKAHSNFYFSVDHIFSKVRGFLGDYSGEVLSDPDNLADSRMEFEIDVKSIDTAIAKRDKHLLSPDLFNAACHPKVVFSNKNYVHG